MSGMLPEGFEGSVTACGAILLGGAVGLGSTMEIMIGSSVFDATAGVGVVPLVSVVGVSGDAEGFEGDATADVVVVLAVVVDGTSCDLEGFEGDATADVVVVVSVVVDGTIGDAVGRKGDTAAAVVVVLSVVVVDGTIGDTVGCEGDTAAAVVVVLSVVVVEALGDALGCGGEAAGDPEGLFDCCVVTNTVGLCTVVVWVPVDFDCVVGPLGAPGVGLRFDGFGWGEATGVGLTGGDDCEPCPSC